MIIEPHRLINDSITVKDYGQLGSPGQRLIEHIFNLDKKEFFTFLKSMALLVVTQQQELRALKDQQAPGSEQSPESSN